jgi:polysaccharide deacetylase family protein (PEP-CTERM system associated)
MQRSDRKQNAFTVDVEDYFHVSAFAGRINPETWPDFQSRVVANTHRILRIVDRHQVPTTFFILGWVAERYPQLVRDIRNSGHEIGCHSHWHRLVYDMNPDEFREDLRRSRDVLQQISGSSVESYRAPSFSITARSLWALDILVEEGFRFDSSIFPVRHDRYGIPDSRPEPFVIETRSGSLREFPPAIVQCGRLRIPIGGGGYLRLYPIGMTLHGLRRINTRWNRPFVMYTHPWEVDPDQPRIDGSRLSRFRHYVNLKSTAGKLDRLATEFEYKPFREILEDLAVHESDDGMHQTGSGRTPEIPAPLLPRMG